MKQAMKIALTTEGFAFIEVVSPCPTAFGRRIGLKDVAKLLQWFEEKLLPLEQADKVTKEQLENKIVVGEFARQKRPTFRENLYEALKEAEKTVRKK